jgi:hypothetical protein
LDRFVTISTANPCILRRAENEAAGQAPHEATKHMERRTPVFIVCSPLPHVGKTLIARLLAEYLHTSGRMIAAFDVNPGDYALAAQLPDLTTKIDIGDTKGQMTLFDRLVVADGAAKMVDLGFRNFDQFFTVMQAIDFVAEARSRSITPVVLFISEPDQRSALGYSLLRERFPGLPVVPVFNAGAEANRRGRTVRPTYAQTPVHIPPLPTIKAMLQQSKPSTAAMGALGGKDKDALRAEFDRVLTQFRELELRLLLEELKPALRLRA